ETVRRILLNRNAMLCNITVDQDNWTRVQPKVSNFLQSLPASPVEIAKWTPTYNTSFEGLTIPAQVNYVGKGANLYDLGYESHGSVNVITNFLRTSWLWEKIRVQGGAYGGFCSFDRDSGVFTYLSYRDPNLLDSLQNYDDTAQFLRNLDISQDEIAKSIIGSIGTMDTYRLPDAKGYTSMARHLLKITEEERQQTRDEIFSTSVAHFKEFGEVLGRLNEAGTVVVLGSQESITDANEKMGDDWLKTMKVL
ncbi:MAG: peptidase M16, partial [Chloroflexota bacterium]